MNLSIGALAAATGVPPNTLRTWERRYGFPPSMRSAGGQRVYDDAVVEHVRLVKVALDLGFRPANTMDVPFDELREMVGRARPELALRPRLALVRPAADPPVQPTAGVGEWLAAAASLSGARLQAALEASLATAGGLEAFVEDDVGPFLTAVGEAWTAGDLSPYQEHFASEHLREFLAARWRERADGNRGPLAVAATLSGEQHDLGLHLAACGAALAGWRVTFLGADTPVPELLSAVRAAGASAVLVSVSSFADPTSTRWNLSLVAERLPADVVLVGGGRGFPEDVPRAVVPGGVRALRELLEARAASGAG